MSITATGVAADPLVFLVGRAVVTVGGEGEEKETISVTLILFSVTTILM